MSDNIKAYDTSWYQRLVTVESGPVKGTFKVNPPSDHGRNGFVAAIDVLISDSDCMLYSNDMTCFIVDGVAELAYYNTRKSADILAAWPDIKLAVEAAAAVFPAPMPREGE